MNSCTYCLESIKEGTKKCPHCCEWVDRGFYLKRSLFSLLPLLMLVACYLYIKHDMKKTLAESDSSRSVQLLKVTSHHRVKTKGSTFIIGEIKNNGPQFRGMLKVEATFYDKDDKLVDLISESISGKFEPNEVRPFKITPYCKKCPGVKEFDHYRLKLRSGV